MSHATGSMTMERTEGAESRTEKPRQPFFQLYKKGQGYYTRVGTAIGAGILAAGLADFVHSQLIFDADWAPGLWLKIGIPVLILVGLGVGIYWLVGVNRRSCDFLIHTNNEMKKVNWTSRREIIAATKVVILVTFLTAIVLFVVDFAFMRFFNWIDVLRQ